MQIFPDMIFTGQPSSLRTLLLKLDASQQIGDWQKDKAAEADLAPMFVGEETTRAYRNGASGSVRQAVLWLSTGTSEWHVTNVVPLESDQLSPADYTQLLRSFRQAVLPLTAGLGITISEPVADVGSDHFLSKKAADLLRSFSVLANKSTGASHPRDRERWNAFVVAVHHDGANLGASELQQLLVENEHWPVMKAEELSLLFEYELSLLNTYDAAL